jgi:hypothetical protein
VNGHVTRRRRLCVLLAGFFGFVTSTAVPGVSGVAVADAISANTAALESWGRAPAAVSTDRCRSTEASAASCEFGVAVLRDSAPGAPKRVVLAVAAEHAQVPPEAFLAAVQVRGPPSITGSRVPVR